LDLVTGVNLERIGTFWSTLIVGEKAGHKRASVRVYWQNHVKYTVNCLKVLFEDNGGENTPSTLAFKRASRKYQRQAKRVGEHLDKSFPAMGKYPVISEGDEDQGSSMVIGHSAVHTPTSPIIEVLFSKEEEEEEEEEEEAKSF